MKSICAALGGNVDHTPAGVGVLRAEIAGLNSEFSYFLYLRTILWAVKCQIGIVTSIQHELALIRPRPVDGEKLIMTLQHRIDRCSSRSAHPRHERHERIGISPEHGQVLDLLWSNQPSDSVTTHIEKRGGVIHRHGLRGNA